MKRKKLRSSRYLAALAITVSVFLIGILVGNYFGELKLQAVYDLEHDMRTQSLGNELVHDLISTDLCHNINMTAYTSELTELGRKLTYLESLYGADASQVKNLKNYYSLLLIRHWIISEQAREQCGVDKPLVLYFYTNYGDCADCEDQGLVLTRVHKDYPLFNIYSLEYHQENPALSFLKEKFDVPAHRLPAMVIDGEIFYGFQSADFLIEHMDLERRLVEDKLIHPEWYD